jgi:hypothetical protein
MKKAFGKTNVENHRYLVKLTTQCVNMLTCGEKCMTNPREMPTNSYKIIGKMISETSLQ